MYLGLSGKQSAFTAFQICEPTAAASSIKFLGFLTLLLKYIWNHKFCTCTSLSIRAKRCTQVIDETHGQGRLYALTCWTAQRITGLKKQSKYAVLGR